MKPILHTTLIATLPLLAASLVACSVHPLTPLDQASNVVVAEGSLSASFCTDAPAAAKQFLKYLIILDHSASNKATFASDDVNNSDPDGAYRYGQLNQFVSTLQDDVNTPTSFALIDFNDTAAQPTDADGFYGKTDFIDYLTKDWYPNGTNNPPAPADSGFTNYQSALDLAFAVIRKDAQAMAVLPSTQGAKTSYVIIFVTDGVPKISSTYTQTFATDLAADFTKIMGLKTDAVVGPFISNITLNTAFYYSAASANLANFQTTILPAATQILTQMADAGRGQFLSFVSGTNGLYQQFAPPARLITNQLIDVFTHNENAVWWSDGNFLPDSDGDGLPDLIEAQQGSNAGLIDSDGNGVSDLVEYRTKGRACDAAGCPAVGRDPYAICSGFGPATDAGGRTTFQSSSNDGLNDCEKFVIGATRTTFNSNGSLIPDFFAFVSQLAVIPGSMDGAFADPFGDGLQNYAKLKLGLPVSISERTLSGFERRGVNLTQTPSADPTIACYAYDVDHIAMSAEQNVVRVMLVQNSSAFQSKPFLKSARAVISVDHSHATFSNSDFK